MRSFLGLQLDRLSFWIGFLTGTLFWFVLSRLGKEWPNLREGLKQWFKHFKQRQLAGTEFAIRQDALRRAQRNHLAANLFALDEVIIPPRLLAPPQPPTGESDTRLPRIHEQLFPPLPQWPEFISRFGATTLSLIQALSQWQRIAIVGKPGSGKTVALAHLASILARREDLPSFATNLTPIFLHYLDIEPFISSTVDPLDPIYRALTRFLPLTSQPRLLSFLKSAFMDGDAVLLLDGLDELPPEMLNTATSYLQSLLTNYPYTRLLLSASDLYLDGLIELGIEPLPLAAWTHDQVEAFVNRWSRLWNQHIGIPTSQKTNIVPLDDLLVRGWVDTTPTYSPLEWTLFIWALLAGDLSSTVPDAIDAYINRLCGPSLPVTSLSTIAHTFIESRKPALTPREIEQAVSELQIPSVASSSNDQEEIVKSPTSTSTVRSARPGNRILLALLDAGLLREHSNERLAFSHPYIMAFLAARHLVVLPETPGLPIWSAEDTLIYHFAALHPETPWFEKWINGDSAHTLYRAFYWARLTPRNAPIRSFLMKRILPTLQSEPENPEVGFEGLAACATTNDPSLTLLFRQWLKANTSTHRLYAALGCGFLRDSGALKDLIVLLNDPEDMVRVGACFALAQYRDPLAEEAVLRALTFGDEALRLAAAEALANIIPSGEEHLKEALSAEDLLTRRAAVIGIANLPAPWVAEELERIAVEDSQWVVRNAATQALESLHQAHLYLHPSTIPPHDAPWLIAFAAKLGQGITPGEPVDSLLQQALIQGNDNEKLSAMAMIRAQPRLIYVQPLKTLLHHDNPEVRHTANYTLWVLSLSEPKAEITN
ncbi:MAG: HEAT repeat domain-containing protein [Thermanaerothrix sp.]|uniref:HEAT repeat domain-containing protein n=1 Tax=Thermanaerothrix sp. TaxID=2972675 RepID=UPI003C7A7D11